MSETAIAKFSCEGCDRSYTWKPELAAKRVKCKCGNVMTVPAAPPAAPEDQDGMYDLAPDPEAAKPKAPRVPLAPIRNTDSPAPAMAAAAPMPQALGYQRGPTAREKQLASNETLLDMKRDIYAPAILLVVGFALYLGYYIHRYDLGTTGIVATGIGLALMTIFKAALLIGFAFVAAGPLGVSFGGLWTAALKLAALAVFCDGVTTWVDYAVGRMSGMGGGGMSGWGVMSFPIALGIYWVLLIYLFSMDSGDSWTVVMVLSVFDQIVKTALIMLLLNLVLNMGGVPASALPGGGSGPPTAMSAHIADLKDSDLLVEARQYIKDGHQGVLSGPTEKWYAAGCTNVWFEVDRDFNGKTSPDQVIIEMPKDKDKRAAVYQIIKDYYTSIAMTPDADDLKDKGDRYITVEIRDSSRGGF